MGRKPPTPCQANDHRESITRLGVFKHWLFPVPWETALIWAPKHTGLGRAYREIKDNIAMPNSILYTVSVSLYIHSLSLEGRDILWYVDTGLKHNPIIYQLCNFGLFTQIFRSLAWCLKKSSVKRNDKRTCASSN